MNTIYFRANTLSCKLFIYLQLSVLTAVVTVHHVIDLVYVLVMQDGLEMIAVQVYICRSNIFGMDLQYTDINECLSYKGGCEYQCTNTQGSYTCSCPTGYSLYSHTACKGKSIICQETFAL